MLESSLSLSHVDNVGEAMTATAEEEYSRLSLRLQALASTVESKRTRVAAMRERLESNRVDLSQLERWRAMLRHSRKTSSHSPSPDTTLADAEWREYQSLLQTADAEGGCDSREAEYAALMREETRLKRAIRQTKAVLRDIEAETRDATVSLRDGRKSLSQAFALREQAERLRLTEIERGQRWQLLLEQQADAQALDQSERQRHQRRKAELERLSKELDVTEQLCDAARLRLSALRQEEEALAHDQQTTLCGWETARQAYEAKLAAMKDAPYAVVRGGGDADGVRHRQLLRKCALAALDVQGSSPLKTDQVSALPTADDNAVADVDISFIQETELMLKALTPLLKGQCQATAVHVARLDALYQSEREGFACSEAALRALVQEKVELSRLLR